MDSQLVTSSSPSFLQSKRQRYSSTNPSWTHKKTTKYGIKFRSIKYHSCYFHHYHNYNQKKKNKKPLILTKASSEETKNNSTRNGLEPLREENIEKKGTISGAVALIIGTSIGSGILALPQKALPAGLFPSSVALIVCWAFLVIEAIVLVEINVGLQRKKGNKKVDQFEVISIRTMAQETLGDFGGNLAAVTYVFLGYTSMVVYSSKSGEILFHLVNLPPPVSGFVFTLLFTVLISLGGTRATDRVNQFFTVVMIGLLVAIEILAVVFGGWSGLEGVGDWGKVPATLPVIIFSLVYHDLVPVLCAYLGSDLKRIRISIFLGSLVPLVSLFVWDVIAFGLTKSADQISDPVELLMSVEWGGVSLMVEAFSLLAIATSLIGTLLGFTEFFKEQLANNSTSWDLFASTSVLQERKNIPFELRDWWEKNKISLTATAAAVAPSLLVSTTVPYAFSAATDFAGGYCMTLLYGVLPPAMAWSMFIKQKEDSDEKALSNARPVLVGVALFACGIVAEQILLHILILHS